jgi:hypothetical protein
MAYKTFANGFPLPASDLNNFLMNQSVIVFADAAARTTAIPSPVEGMLTYLEDTNAYESWNGSAFVALAEEPDLSSLIPKSTVTTAQDLIVADGASSVTRLGVGADDQVLSVVAGSVAWADAGGGGGFNSSVTITATNSSYPIPTMASDIIKVTVVGGGGGGGAYGDSTKDGSSGGTSSVAGSGLTTISASGGEGGINDANDPRVDAVSSFVSANFGHARAGEGEHGGGGEVKFGYLNINGLTTLNMTIGAGGSGGATSVKSGFRGEIVMEYLV